MKEADSTGQENTKCADQVDCNFQTLQDSYIGAVLYLGFLIVGLNISHVMYCPIIKLSRKRKQGVQQSVHSLMKWKRQQHVGVSAVA